MLTIVSNKEVLTWVRFSHMIINTWAQHANPWAKLHFIIGL